MKKRMKKLTALLLSAAMVLSLSACNGTENNTDKDTSKQETTGESSQSNDGESVKIKITWWGGQDRHEYTQNMLDYYSTEVAPNVEFEAVPAGWDGYFEKMSTEAGSGGMPDIVAMDYLYISTFSSNNSIADLSEFVDSGVIDLSGIDESLYEAGRIDGKLTGIVGSTSTMAISYNPAVFEEAGVDVPDANWTWDDLVEVCIKIQENTGKFGYGVIMGADDTNAFHYYIRQRGGQLIADDNKSLGYDDDQIFVDFIQWQKELIDLKAMPNPDEYDQSKAVGQENGPVVTGEAAMISEWQNYPSKVVEVNDTLKLLPLPQLEGGEKGFWMKPGYFWSVSENSKVKEEAAKFINWIVNSTEAAGFMGLERGIPSSSVQREFLLSSEDITEKEVEMFDYMDLVAELSGDPVAPDPVGISEVMEELTNAVYGVLYGQSTPEEATATFRANANDILERKN